MKVCKSMLVLLLAGSMPLVLAAEGRQHGAHEHGVGKLDIAQEGAELHIELDSPAVNIVGFEHAPKNDAEHETLERALTRLKDGAALFALPGAAGCRLVSTDAQAPLVDHEESEARHDDHHDVHHDNERHEAHHDEHGHGHEDDHGYKDVHADITVTWRYTCAHPDTLDRVSVRLFAAFPMTERLQVRFITEKNQSAVELSASQPELRF